MAKDARLASSSPPYERVPNISQYKFSNLFIIYPLNIHITIHNASGKNNKCIQHLKWPQFTSNPIISTTQRRVHTHAKPRPLARNGKRRGCHKHVVANQTMASTRIRRHLQAVDCYKIVEYLENSEQISFSLYTKLMILHAFIL